MVLLSYLSSVYFGIKKLKQRTNIIFTIFFTAYFDTKTEFKINAIHGRPLSKIQGRKREIGAHCLPVIVFDRYIITIYDSQNLFSHGKVLSMRDKIC
jgi:hypothetical protein